MKPERSDSPPAGGPAGGAPDSARALLGLFVENVRDYAIFTLDSAGLVTSWNIGAERIKGYTADEVIGKPWSIFYTPEDIARGWPAEVMRRAKTEGRVEDTGLRMRKDGTRFWARVVLSANYDENHVLRGFIKITQDISEQKRAEQELRENEERFRAFSENFPGFHWIADSNGRFQFANRHFQRELRLPAGGFVGKSPEELFEPETARVMLQGNQIVLATNAPLVQTESLTSSGSTRHFLVSKFPIRIDGQTLIGCVSFDITSRIEAEDELKRMREELIRQERLGSIAQLSSALAHDLNNTLNAISLRLWTIRENANAPSRPQIDKLSELLARAAASVARLQTFVRSHREPQLQPLGLNRVIQEAAEAARSTFTQRGVTIDLSQVHADLPPVLGLGSDVEQIFTNLFTNAHDSMPDGGMVEVSAEINQGQIEVAIADRGTGIPTDSLDKIFEPFFTTKPKPRSGLGLSFAASVMARTGGSIGASNRIGGGAVFMLIFPVARDYPSERAIFTREPPVGAMRVLVIDDDHDNLDSMKDALEYRGYAVSIASGGQDALELLRSGVQFDAIICDIGMPDMNGWEVAEKISDLKIPARLFMLSGWANEVPQGDPRRKLVVDVLAKPINLERIDQVLRYS
ncbi:MAG TPA: PAS domain S-box protein [Candidatus Binataceae bacterium]|nr:PAS domain S-box protein [Candidatus Binataceae bacterium]